MKLLFQIDGRIFVADIIYLLLSSLDIVLGMDWFSANHVMLNCYEKTIIFPSTLSSEFMIPKSLNLNSLVVNCCKIKSQGYILLLASVSENEKLGEIHVVREYPNVFPKDILELPPEREMTLTKNSRVY